METTTLLFGWGCWIAGSMGTLWIITRQPPRDIRHNRNDHDFDRDDYDDYRNRYGRHNYRDDEY